MKHLRAFVAAGGLISAAAACTARDSLLDEVGTSGAGTAAAGSASGQAGSGQSSGGGAQSKGAASSIGSSGTAGSPVTNGGAAEVPVDPPECPDGQMWCPGCIVGTGLCAVGCPGAACEPCSDVTTQEECDVRLGCHSVFLDGNECSCPAAGCCLEFVRCADGDQADCQDRDVLCDVRTPACGPSFVTSYMGSCYSGCVDPKDCAPSVCPAVNDPSGCACYSDAECASGQHCYSADCTNNVPGTCREPPPEGCFGDADCPLGQTCIGGRPAPCGTTQPDAAGTCGVEACPEGDCPGTGPTCTCSAGGQCVAATGPLGSGQCRGADGVCLPCVCASPDTPIATPHGERRIAELRTGDLVYSVDGEAIRAVPIVRVNRTPVVGHHVLHVTFENGRFIEMSAGHPLADGRPLTALSPGSELMGGAVASITRVAYPHDATYDILPDSTSGAYFASGVLIGSTLAGPSHHARGRQATAW